MPVYGYEFDEAPLNSFIKGDQSGIDLKAYHGAEFPFVFYNPMVKLSSAQEQYAQHIRAEDVCTRARLRSSQMPASG